MELTESKCKIKHLIAHTQNVEERTSDIQLKSLTPFNDMQLLPELRVGLKKCGFEYPTLLQASAISMGIVGLDLIIQAKSGTGKTLVFCTVLLNNYKPHVYKPQALVITPTREIAVQITQILNELARDMNGFQAMCAIGGIDVLEDRKRLQHARAVVGTPGRLLHLIKNNLLNITGVTLLVLDEADKLLMDTLSKDVNFIIGALSKKRQTICCSATFDTCALHEQFNRHMSNPLLVAAEAKATVVVGVKQFAYSIPPLGNSYMEISLKLRALDHIFSTVRFKQCIVFAGTQIRAETYCSGLRREGWACAYISAAQDQKARLEIFQLFREGKINILIATDLMSRGIDLSELNLVVNLELPTKLATYMHRIGRAGRFGTYGIAVNVLGSLQDYANFKQLMEDNNHAMHILKFPFKRHDNSLAEGRDFFDFDSLQKDIEYYGVFDIRDYNEVTEINEELPLKEKCDLVLNTETFSVNEQEEGEEEEEEEVIHLPSSNTIDDASSLLADESMPSTEIMDEQQRKQLCERIKPLLMQETFKPNKKFMEMDFFVEYRNFNKNLKNTQITSN